MASAIEKAHALFTSKFVQSAETIREKLASAQTALAELESQVSDLAYATAIEEEGAAERMAALTGEIARGKENVTLLQTALQVAEAKEAERLAEAERAANRARVRGLAQHLGSLRTAGAAYERSVSEMAKTWQDMLTASDKIRKLLGDASAVMAKGVHPSRLKALCEAELRRIAYPEHPSTPGLKFALPGVSKPLFWKEDAPTLTAVLASLSEGALQSEGGTGNE